MRDYQLPSPYRECERFGLIFPDAVAHPRAAHADRTDAGHDLALWQMAVAHQPLAAIIGRLVGVPTEQGRDLGLDSLQR